VELILFQKRVVHTKFDIYVFIIENKYELREPNSITPQLNTLQTNRAIHGHCLFARMEHSLVELITNLDNSQSTNLSTIITNT
jgi:hypothetical protein